ncbi:MAG: hypothetical protein ABH805_01665 [Candidatus Nealsonbacteria bacterium]
MSEATKTKRQGGQIEDDKWLVLAESTEKKGVGYIHSCGTKIQGKTVFHPIWNGPFPLSGNGRVQPEIVPFCPKCEKEPSSSGAPISPKGSYYNP